MTTRPADQDPPVRPELVESLADYLLRYPQDLIDTKRLLKSFCVSASEFQQALVRSQQEEEQDVVSSTASTSPMRRDMVHKLMAYLRHYPQDIVDAKCLIKRFQVSADEFQQALLNIEA